MLEITPQDLDANPYLLCTPDATYDLRLGMAGAREHSPEDFITKTTTVSPGDRGKQIWLDCLDTIFCGDQELIDYVQMIWQGGSRSPHHRIRLWPQRQVYLLEFRVPRPGSVQR